MKPRTCWLLGATVTLGCAARPLPVPPPVIIHEEPKILELHLWPNPPVRVPFPTMVPGEQLHEGEA